MKHCLLASLLVSSVSLRPAVAQAQDAAKVLNLFQSFLGVRQPAVPAAPAGGMAGALLGAALASWRPTAVAWHWQRAGFDPYGLVAVLQQLRTAAADDALFALSLSTHPPAQLRLNQLELAMGNRLDAYSGQSALTIAQRLQSLAASASRSSPQAAAPRAAPVQKKN